MVRWLVEGAERVPRVAVAGVDMSGVDAAVIGWEKLPDVLHARGPGIPDARWSACSVLARKNAS